MRLTAGVFGEITGNVSHDAVDAGNPVKIGGRAYTGPPVAVANADRVDAAFDEFGSLRIINVYSLIQGDALQGDAGTFRGASSNTERALAQMLYGIAPDGFGDRLRMVGDTAALGLGVAAVSPRTPGATEIISTVVAVVTTPATRRTLATPASGLRIRLLSYTIFSTSASEPLAEIYFGTGATIFTNPASAADNQPLSFSISPDIPSIAVKTWPDGAGPIGAIDEMLSTRINLNVQYTVVAQWREE